MRTRRSRTQLKDSLRASANQQRDATDEMALMFGGVDDPLHPFMPGGEGQPFRDWIDFTRRVCVPLVEADDEATIQAAMALYRKASPNFIAISLVFALNSIASARTTTGSAATEQVPAVRPPSVPPTAEGEGT